MGGNCYNYNYTNNTGNLIDINGFDCLGDFYFLQVEGFESGQTDCIQQLSAQELTDLALLGLSMGAVLPECGTFECSPKTPATGTEISMGCVYGAFGLVPFPGANIGLNSTLGVNRQPPQALNVTAIAASAETVLSGDMGGLVTLNDYCCIPSIDSFVSTWNTANTGYQTSNFNQVRLPLYIGGVYNFNVDWGDGSSDTITTWNQAETLHTYSTPGIYTITINGTCIQFAFTSGYPTFANSGDNEKLLSIVSWGNVIIGNLVSAFMGCVNLDLSGVQDVPNLSTMNSLNQTFAGCTSLTTINNINSWNLSTITSTSGMFGGATSFNQSLNSWNMSNVTETSFMFQGATNFNGNITGWDVSNVTKMQFMFADAVSFNQNIGSWDVSSVDWMGDMFKNATAFNQNIGSWDISSILFSFDDFMSGKSSSNYSATNLNAIYNGWSTSVAIAGITINFGTIKYTAAGQSGRNILTGSPWNWTITDGGI